MLTFDTIDGLTEKERELFKLSFKGEWDLTYCNIENHSVRGVMLPGIVNGVVER